MKWRPPESVEVTLTIPYDLPDQDWEAIDRTYREMDGWIESDDVLRWYGGDGDERHLSASVKFGGVQIAGRLEPSVFFGWITVLCALLSRRLDRDVCDADSIPHEWR